MQAKIDELFKYNKDKVDLDLQRAKDNLHSDEFMATEKGFVKNYNSQKYEGPTYENSHSPKINWGAEQYNTPRAFTIRNIKDLFYANLNRSKA